MYLMLKFASLRGGKIIYRYDCPLLESVETVLYKPI